MLATGFLQKHGIYFHEVYAPLARMETIRIIVSTASYKGWKIHQLDVKSIFPNGPLEEEVYASQTLGFKTKGHE